MLGTVSVSGWGLDNYGSITEVKLSVDGVSLPDPAYGVSRTDVCNAFPGGQDCPNVGWNGQLNTMLLSNGSHVLEITAFSTTGLHATTSTTISVGNWLSVPTRISIDTPSRNGNPISGPINFGGWAVDDYSSIVSVAIAIDGISYGNASYGSARPDVCTVLPGRSDCPNVGWNFPLDVTLLTNGIHSLEVTATTSAGWHSTSTTAFTVRNAYSGSYTIHIDQPQNTPLKGITPLYGWALGSEYLVNQVEISVDGMLLGTAHYGDPRPDVCQVFPNAFQCYIDQSNVGWDFLLDTTRLTNGPHWLNVTAETTFIGGSTVSKWFTVDN